jgi:hypothetical protein
MVSIDNITAIVLELLWFDKQFVELPSNVKRTTGRIGRLFYNMILYVYSTVFEGEDFMT